MLSVIDVNDYWSDKIQYRELKRPYNQFGEVGELFLTIKSDKGDKHQWVQYIVVPGIELAVNPDQKDLLISYRLLRAYYDMMDAIRNNDLTEKYGEVTWEAVTNPKFPRLVDVIKLKESK